MSTTIKPAKFEYLRLPELRFIGIDAWRTKEDWGDMWRRKDEILQPLDAIKQHVYSGLPYAAAFCHHDDGEINDHNEPDRVNLYLIGMFFNKDTPIPNGYDYHDLKAQTAGIAVFENMTDINDEFWQRYIITRDTILNDGVTIPYPVGYWHAEVYYDKTPIIAENDSPFDCGVLFATNKE